MSTQKLNERAMLANLTISYWQAARTDKKISSDVAQQHKVSERRAGHYRKFAIDTETPSYRAVMTAAGEIRQAHYKYTLPWGQDGARILTALSFEDYSAQIRKARAKFETAVIAFIAEFPAIKEKARIEMNGMFNDDDYPKDLKRKFGVYTAIMPLPDSKDFRVDLPDDAVSEIKASIEAELQKTTLAAMQEPYERLHAHIARMVGALSDPKGIFRDTLITGMADLCSVLPGLNLTSDPKLDELRRQCEAMISGIEAQDLRDSPKTRRKVAQQAREIQNVMAGFMGAA